MNKQLQDTNKSRLNITTQIMCAMMAGPINSNIQGTPAKIADALIAEGEKGGVK